MLLVVLIDIGGDKRVVVKLAEAAESLEKFQPPLSSDEEEEEEEEGGGDRWIPDDSKGRKKSFS
jgi:hypothetical protein